MHATYVVELPVERVSLIRRERRRCFRLLFARLLLVVALSATRPAAARGAWPLLASSASL